MALKNFNNADELDSYLKSTGYSVNSPELYSDMPTSQPQQKDFVSSLI